MSLRKLFLCIIAMILSMRSFSATKEVVYDCSTNTLKWGYETRYIPCLETFNFKVINCPTGTTDVEVIFYESIGDDFMTTKIDSTKGTPYIAAKTITTTEFIATIPSKSHKRYYFINVKIVSKVSTTSDPNVTIASNFGKPKDLGSGITEQINTMTTTTKHPSSPTNTPSETVTTTKDVITTQIKKIEDKVYAVPLKSELTYFEVLFSVSSISIPQNGVWGNADFKVGFISGLKFHFAPVSTSNPNIGRYALYPRLSKWSATIGALITDVSYKGVPISAALVGLRPTVGLDWETLNGALGISGGTFLGQQEIYPKLSTDKRLVAGFYLGLSFSADVFTRFKTQVPATGLTP